MFNKLREFGQHSVYSYDISNHTFLDFFQELYKTKELDKLHQNKTEFDKNNLSDIETSLHKIFYAEIKSNDTFKKLYCNFIQDIHKNFFGQENIIIYQSFPSIRFQFINNVTVPPHYDSDDLGKHPLGEKNFIIPITNMKGSRRLFIESEPGKKDFQGIDLEYGELFYFNGNKCTHYNQVNIEDNIRISLDFRIILLKDYMDYIQSGNITSTNPRDPEKKRVPTKMIIGGYYQASYKNESIEEMMKWHFQKDMILQSQPSFDCKEGEACFDYLKDGDNFITEFKKTEELEKMISDYIGCKHVIMTTSGNMALILALLAYEFKQEDEIIVPNYTMIATINSIKFVGAKPIIVDVDANSFTLNLQTIKKAHTLNTRAIMHVSLNNRHSNINEITEYCKNNNLILIEDAAQSLGCFLDGKHFGTFGEIGCFSLSTPKIISTGQGGFLTTNNDHLANRIRMIKNFGRKISGLDIFEVFGINGKFTDIQAVIGIEQMKKLPERVKRIREIFDLYYKYLPNLMLKPEFDNWIPWFIDIFTNDRELLIDFLKAHNIQTRSTYPEINKTPMYFEDCDLENSKYVSNNGLFLPTHMKLTNEQIIYICKIINIFFEFRLKNI